MFTAMNCCKIFLLLTFQNIYCNKDIIWRYSNHIVESDIFSIRDTIKLEYLGDESSLQWKYPEGCQVDNSSSSSTLLTCAETGPVAVSLAVSVGNSLEESPSKYIELQDYYACYQWYLAKVENSSQNALADKQVYTARVWVIDYHYASIEEKTRTATVPSEYSRELTGQFEVLGQLPQLRFISDGLHFYSVHLEYTGYSWTCGCWEFSYHVDTIALPLFSITGKAIALFGCYIQDTNIGLPEPSYKVTNEELRQYKLAGSVSLEAIKVIKDPCSQNVAAVLTRDTFLFTQDNFRTTQRVYFEYAANITDNWNVTAAVFTLHGLVLLVDGSVFLIQNNGTMTAITGIPSNETLLGLKARDWCTDLISERHLVEPHLFVAWSSTIIYLHTHDNPGIATPLALPYTLFEAVGYDNLTWQANVTDVAVDPVPGKLGIAVVLLSPNVFDNTTVVFVVYDWFAQQWQLLSTTISGPDHISFLYLTTGRLGFLAWDNKSLFYSYDNGEEHGTMKLYSCDTSQLAGRDEWIQQVLVNYAGEIIILLSTSKLFYSKSSFSELIQVESGELSSSDVSVWFDGLNQLHILTLEGGAIQRRLLPLRTEVAGAVHPLKSCSYHDFVHNVNMKLYHCDMGDTINLWAMLIYPEFSQHSVMFAMTGEEYLQYHTSSSFQHSTGVLAENMTLILYHNMEFTGSRTISEFEAYKKIKSGMVSFELRPSKVNLACDSPIEVVSYVAVGCPDKRHIRIKKPDKLPSCAMFTSYVLPKKSYRTEEDVAAASDKTASYDWETLGCPIPVHKTDTFLPVIHLYDDHDFVRPVTANFIVWEEQGRVDFDYNTTMKQADCKRTAQRWLSMKDEENNGSDAWGPHNYQSCFEKTDVVEDLSGPYEILNSTGLSVLTFNDSEVGIYVFRVRVVDPNYSYCALETRVAIEVIEVPIEVDLTALGMSVLVFCSVILITLGVTYVYFTKVTYLETQTDDELLEDDVF